jgi:hypothetical protein
VILRFTADEVAPPRADVLAQLGIPEGAVVPERTTRLLDAAASLFAEHVAAAGVVQEIDGPAFAEVYRGDGRNAPDSPVARIAPRAERRHLFAVTLGDPLGAELRARFAAEDFARGVVLDATASVAADLAADLVERRVESGLRAQGWATPDGAVLRYSPGYCGWDVTGQGALFAALRPERIGLTLTPSCLMQPLKSVSGVVLAGPRSMHRFPPDYPFCEPCETRTCRDRLRTLAQRAALSAPETV